MLYSIWNLAKTFFSCHAFYLAFHSPIIKTSICACVRLYDTRNAKNNWQTECDQINKYLRICRQEMLMQKQYTLKCVLIEVLSLIHNLEDAQDLHFLLLLLGVCMQ